jgi:hypothetical protein
MPHIYAHLRVLMLQLLQPAIWRASCANVRGSQGRSQDLSLQHLQMRGTRRSEICL